MEAADLMATHERTDAFRGIKQNDPGYGVEGTVQATEGTGGGRHHYKDSLPGGAAKGGIFAYRKGSCAAACAYVVIGME